MASDPEKSDSIPVLAAEDRALSVAHLQATITTEELLLRDRLHTVGALLDRLSDNERPETRSAYTPGPFRDIGRDLGACLLPDGRLDWDSYRERSKRWRNLAVTSPRLERLSECERSRGMAMLHMRKAHKFLVGEGIKTVGDFLERLRVGIPGPLELTSVQKNEIFRGIAALSATIDKAGKVDWMAYGAQVGVSLIPETLTPVEPREGFVVLTSSSLDRMSVVQRAQEVSALRFRYANKPLHAAGILTVGDLIDAARSGVRGVGLRAGPVKDEIFRGLTALAASVTDAGEVDWPVYMSRTGTSSVTDAATGDDVPGDPLERLPALCRQILTHSKANSERDWIIFQKRFLGPPDRRTTLEGLAEIFGVSRERVRQIQERLVEVIRSHLIISSRISGEFVVHSRTSELWGAAVAALSATGDGLWLKSAWCDVICTAWGVSPSKLDVYNALVCSILGYEEVRPDDEALTPIMLRTDQSKMDAGMVRISVDAIHDELSEHGASYDAVDLLRIVKKRFPKGQGPNLQDLPRLVELCSTAEVVGDAQYRGKLTALRRREDQVVRILEEQGKPMDLRDIVREINRWVVPGGGRALLSRSLAGRLSDDPRIVPIGKTGMWALSHWGNETRSIASLVEACLHETGEVLSEEDIWKRVSSLRPMSRLSIPLILRNTGRFRQTGPRSWALKQWGDIKSDNWGTSDRVGRFIENFFTERALTRAIFGDLRTALMRESGMSARAAQGALSHHRALRVERPDARTRVAIFQPGWRTAPALVPERRKRASPGKMDSIEELIRVKLANSPSRELPLSRIVKELEVEVKASRPSVYAVVSRSKVIDTYQPVPGGSKICRLMLGSRDNPPAAIVTTREERLRAMLQTMFTIDELKHFLRTWPATIAKVALLPESGATHLGFTWELVLLLQREGLLRELWPRLYHQRPERSDEIRSVAALFT